MRTFLATPACYNPVLSTNPHTQISSSDLALRFTPPSFVTQYHPCLLGLQQLLRGFFDAFASRNRDHVGFNTHRFSPAISYYLFLSPLIRFSSLPPASHLLLSACRLGPIFAFYCFLSPLSDLPLYNRVPLVICFIL